MGGSLKGYDIVDSGLTPSNILWRYMDLGKFIDLLESRSLRLSRADTFSDKFEGSFTPSLKLLIEKAYDENGLQMTYREFKDKLRERIYINCWCNRKTDSIAMWKLYGQSDNAIAVTTTVSRIRNAVMGSKYPLKTYIRKVNYIDHLDNPEIEIRPYSNIFSYKQKAYDYEKEVRIVLDLYHEMYKDREIPKSISIPAKLEDFISAVVISPFAEEWFSDLVKSIMIRYKLDVPVTPSKLSFEPV